MAVVGKTVTKFATDTIKMEYENTEKASAAIVGSL
jgi:hypothetical protein